jgi:predicted nucleic acid-binding protein
VTLVDTNVLIDLFDPGSGWADWSVAALAKAAASGPLVINDMVFAELSVGFDACSACEAFLSQLEIELLPVPRAALFLAGQAHRAYRRRGGERTNVLPDFFIGAHAAHAGLPLITRDPRRFALSFPSLQIIAP